VLVLDEYGYKEVKNMKLQIKNWRPMLPKPLGKPRLLRLLEELELMQRFKSSKEEFDKGKREEMKDKRKKEATDKKEYAERHGERTKSREMLKTMQRLRDLLEDFKNSMQFGLMRKYG
ncbi:hypothetical protein J4450_03295, partial [Candidatus Micrarchaeota archaeon]|nr:hypothetical protein [Candidatus Micrarchaeota archaeon]